MSGTGRSGSTKRQTKAQMKWVVVPVSYLLIALAIVAPTPSSSESTGVGSVSPIFGVSIPDGYRRWEMVAPAHETDPLNELRTVLGNGPAIATYQAGTLPFPDGAILVKLAWKHVQSEEFAPAFVSGAPTTVQVMVKDSKKYAATGGWGFGRFVNGKPVDEAQHRTCFACHSANVRNHDFVFARFAP
jgi:hypothetical protein